MINNWAHNSKVLPLMLNKIFLNLIFFFFASLLRPVARGDSRVQPNPFRVGGGGEKGKRKKIIPTPIRNQSVSQSGSFPFSFEVYQIIWSSATVYCCSVSLCNCESAPPTLSLNLSTSLCIRWELGLLGTRWLLPEVVFSQVLQTRVFTSNAGVAQASKY